MIAKVIFHFGLYPSGLLPMECVGAAENNDLRATDRSLWLV